jgi:hypothetical protein
LPSGGLELFYEILYDRNNHASGRRGNRICAETNAPRHRRDTQGTDSGNDRTRTFALMRLAFVSRSATDS